MAKRTRYSEYCDRYANYRFELSDDGILLMQCHTNGGSLVWDRRAHDRMSDAFADITGNREIKVLIPTGTAFFPFGGEMAPLDRAWDREPWSNGLQRSEGVPS